MKMTPQKAPIMFTLLPLAGLELRRCSHWRVATPDRENKNTEARNRSKHALRVAEKKQMTEKHNRDR